MAAELPIVSTAIRDVEQPYGDVVAIGHSAEEFVAHIEAALAQSAEQTAAMAQKMRDVVAKTSWENTATRMRDLIENATPARKFQRLTAQEMSYDEAADNVNPLRTTATAPKVGSLIGGPVAGGVTAAAYQVAQSASAQAAVKAE
jgi:hypothetical protein